MAKEQGTMMTLVLPKGILKRLPGFPRGEFLSETERGKVYRFDPDKIIKWVNSIGK